MNEPRMLPAFIGLLRRDLLLAYRARGEAINPLVFFVMVACLFPLATSAAPNLLRTLAPGVIWVTALLATLLSMDQLFRGDYEDGALEQLVLSPQPLALLALAKILAHWLVTGLPLTLTSPLLAMFLQLPDDAYPALLLTLLFGTPVLSAIGSIGAALTVSLRRGGILLSLLILPLYIPVLIFAASAVDAAGHGLPVTGQLLLLAALAVGALTLAPLATAAALRISLD